MINAKVKTRRKEIFTCSLKKDQVHALFFEKQKPGKNRRLNAFNESGFEIE